MVMLTLNRIHSAGFGLQSRSRFETSTNLKLILLVLTVQAYIDGSDNPKKLEEKLTRKPKCMY